MKESMMTDQMVEEEIRRLWGTAEVKLAKKEQQIKYRRRQQLYTLRNMAKRGAELMRQGVTMDNIETELFGGDEE